MPRPSTPAAPSRAVAEGNAAPEDGDQETYEGSAVLRIADEDQYWERTVVEWWLDEHGLPVRMTTTKESKSPSDLVGDVIYTEQYTADLVSLDPLR